MLSVALALGLLAAIISILAHFEGRTLPDWPLSINLNTLIALLATIMRAVMLVAVCEVLSQLKWSWFSRPRPLSDLQRFDRASRGAYGSVQLLFVAPTNVLVVLGALIMITSAAVGPFTQQAVKTVNCPQYLARTNASVPVAHYMGFSSQAELRANTIGPATYSVPVGMKGAMVNGLVNPTGNDSSITATCQTGNCTFQADSSNITYSSIGMCSACIDTTPLVTSNGPSVYENNTVYANWTLPNDLSIFLGVLNPILNVTTDSSLSWASSAFTDKFKDVAIQAVNNITMLAFTREPCTNNSGVFECPHNVTSTTEATDGAWDYVATSCALYPCLKNYHGSVSDAVLREEVVSTETAAFNWVGANISYTKYWDMAAYNYPAGNFTAIKSPCLVDDFTYTKENFTEVPRTPGRLFTGISVDGVNYTVPEECLYSLSVKYVNAMEYFMTGTVFDGNCVWADDTTYQPDCSSSWWLSPLYNSEYASFESLSSAMGDFTTVVTNKFRTSGSSNYIPGQQESTLGAVIELTICTELDWQWLLMPIILVAATAALLLLMVLNSHRDTRPVWKSSLLPLIFYGVKDTPPADLPQAVDLGGLDEYAKQRHASFNAGMGAHFVDGGGHANSRDIDVDSLMVDDDRVRR